jgi:UrcA family protein
MKSIVTRPAALLIGTAMLAATFVTHQACAQSGPEEVSQVRVHYSDLDLEQPEGARRLYRRIKSAAQEVCHMQLGADLRLLQMQKRCMSNAVSRAVDQVQSAQLRALYSSDTQHGWIG